MCKERKEKKRGNCTTLAKEGEGERGDRGRERELPEVRREARDIRVAVEGGRVSSKREGRKGFGFFFFVFSSYVFDMGQGFFLCGGVRQGLMAFEENLKIAPGHENVGPPLGPSHQILLLKGKTSILFLHSCTYF